MSAGLVGSDFCCELERSRGLVVAKVGWLAVCYVAGLLAGLQFAWMSAGLHGGSACGARFFREVHCSGNKGRHAHWIDDKLDRRRSLVGCGMGN